MTGKKANWSYNELKLLYRTSLEAIDLMETDNKKLEAANKELKENNQWFIDLVKKTMEQDGFKDLNPEFQKLVASGSIKMLFTDYLQLNETLKEKDKLLLETEQFLDKLFKDYNLSKLFRVELAKTRCNICSLKLDCSTVNDPDECLRIVEGNP
jgi:replicative DNA helicase